VSVSFSGETSTAIVLKSIPATIHICTSNTIRERRFASVVCRGPRRRGKVHSRRPPRRSHRSAGRRARQALLGRRSHTDPQRPVDGHPTTTRQRRTLDPRRRPRPLRRPRSTSRRRRYRHCPGLPALALRLARSPPAPAKTSPSGAGCSATAGEASRSSWLPSPTTPKQPTSTCCTAHAKSTNSYPKPTVPLDEHHRDTTQNTGQLNDRGPPAACGRGPACQRRGIAIPAKFFATHTSAHCQAGSPSTDSDNYCTLAAIAAGGTSLTLLSGRLAWWVIGQGGQYLVPPLFGKHIAGAGTDALGVVGIEIEDADGAVSANGVQAALRVERDPCS
jgi:hypothetical protein